ncbi:WD40 repeat-like protein [Hesseltinella vesiculosa]|uniref:WD40 repeat-like protein n=1 Tax=Hesseltinella vesiculosa TaxID=101127 RepID=A0A1X2GWG5_9FUNG|nr:WD40 repeat-like protein [Hesseltinella vesiculosa]
MLAKTIEINWHDTKAVYSVDFSTDGQRLATAGADASVRIWSIQRAPEKKTNHHGQPQLPLQIDFLSELKRHTSPVNVVRFSPNCQHLATAGDDTGVVIWQLSNQREHAFGSDHDDFEKETWKPLQLLYGHTKEIYDLAWSPCSQYLVTASIDNTARVWSIPQKSCIHVIRDHTHYVQGVTWDPLGKYVATQSSDRSVNVYQYRKLANGTLEFDACCKRHTYLYDHKKKLPTTAAPSLAPATTTPANPLTMDASDKATTEDTAMETEDEVTPTPAPVPARTSHALHRLYHDENLVSFFRRLAFSPDGGLLVTPAGICKDQESDCYDDDSQHCSYVYARNSLRKHPIGFMGQHIKPSISVRWSPQFYALRPGPSVFQLTYRMVYAIATQDSLYIYDTQQASPLCALTGFHYAPITDLSWSSDGTILTFSSADGYCSAAVFDENELGVATAPPMCHEDAPMTALDSPAVTHPPASPPGLSTVFPSHPTNTATSTTTKIKRITPTFVSPHWTPPTASAATDPTVHQPTSSTINPAKKRIQPTLVFQPSNPSDKKKRRIVPILISSNTSS